MSVPSVQHMHVHIPRAFKGPPAATMISSDSMWLWAFNYRIGPGGLGKIQIACHRNMFGSGAILNESLSASRAAWPLGAKSRTE